MEDLRLDCTFCGQSLRPSHFEEGRAITLLGRPYCEVCVEAAVKERRRKGGAGLPATGKSASPPEKAPGPSWQQRRLHLRFAPPQECELFLEPKPPRQAGMNAVRLWVDVSEGGLRAIVSGDYTERAQFTGHLSHASTGASHSLQAEARYAKASPKYPGCMILGLQFVTPSPNLVGFIREMLQVSGPPDEPVAD